MKILSFIEDPEVIKKILKHPPIAPSSDVSIDYSAHPPRPETGTGSGGATHLYEKLGLFAT